MIRRTVLLPEPFSPSTPILAPWKKERLMSLIRLFIIKLAHSDHGVDNLLRFVGHTIAQSFIVLEE